MDESESSISILTKTQKLIDRSYYIENNKEEFLDNLDKLFEIYDSKEFNSYLSKFHNLTEGYIQGIEEPVEVEIYTKIIDNYHRVKSDIEQLKIFPTFLKLLKDNELFLKFNHRINR